MVSSKWFSLLPKGSPPLLKARFVERPNRFLVHCEDDAGNPVQAFLPNPGRLQELLLPDAVLYLLHQPETAAQRATLHTVLAVERAGRPIMLHTHWCNHMARQLIEAKSVPGLEDAEIQRSEITVGRSRFDFLLQQGQHTLYLEVKSCTLFGNGVAMFPDAVTERGRRHLLELADIAATGRARCAALFVVQTPTVRCFMPDYHTDPAFARAMLATRDHVAYLPLPVTFDRNLRFRPATRTLPIPWDHVATESADKGAYLLILHLSEARDITVGALGAVHFAAGYYIYVGSAMNGLTARMARHRRKRKRMHWHIDYLRAEATCVEILPIRASARHECDIARALNRWTQQAVPGFGCADCACGSHLFYWPVTPLSEAEFHHLLQEWRMRLPSTMAE